MHAQELLPVLLLAASLTAQHPHTSRDGARLLPLPKEEGVFHFVVFGDRTGGPAEGIKVLEQAVQDTNLLGPDLVMTVGDLVQGYNSTDQWMEQMREFRGVMNGLHCAWFPVPGNHDVYWRNNPNKNEKKPIGEHEKSYEKHFGPLWYWFEHKNAAFFVLYTDEGDRSDNTKSFGRERHIQMSDEQLGWLRAELNKVADKDHVFVFCHHPRWQYGADRKTNWNKVHDVLKNAGNVTAVFGGHIHRMTYSGKRDGIEYFTLATTGGHKSVDLPGGGFVHHLNVVTVRKDRVTHATIPVGAVMDPKMMTEEHLAAIDSLRRLRPAVSSGPVRVDRRGGCLGVFKGRFANETGRPIELTFRLFGDESWAIGPDHVHAKIAPGASKEIEIAYGREPKGFLYFNEPRWSLQVDYLAKGLRVSLPEVERPLPVTLASVPPGFFDPLDFGALKLSGRGACLRVSSRALDLPDGPMTVEAWLEPGDLKGRRALVAKTESCEFGLFVSDHQPAFSIHLDGEYRSPHGEKGQLAAGRWAHVAGVFDGKEARLYVDGELVAATPASGKRTRSANPLFVGADPNRNGQPMSFAAGLVDEVRISKVARYAGPSFRPALRHEADGDTVLLLHLDKDLGPFAPDESPRGAHAKRVGSAHSVRIAKDAKRL